QLMTALFSTFLAKYLDRKKTCISYPVSLDRTQRENILGSFINMALMPINITNKTSFLELINTIKMVRENVKNAVCTYDKVVSELREYNVIKDLDSSNVVIAEADLKLDSIDFHNIFCNSLNLSEKSGAYDIKFIYQKIE